MGLMLAACAPLAAGAPSAPPLTVRELPTPTAPRDTGGVIELPRPTGPFSIGLRTFHAVDLRRGEPFTPDTTDHREVVFHVLYPAAAKGGSLAAFMTPMPDDSVYIRSYAFIGFEKLARVRRHALAAPPFADDSRHPVILFSHGLGSISALYTTFQENLASHGYVVVGVDHPFFAAAFRLPDGRTVRRLSNPAERQRDVVTQAEDLSFVLDVLTSLDRDAAGSLRGRLDLDHVGVFGHSRGGFAAPHACLLDRRFDACVNLDGWELSRAVQDRGIAQPYMHVEEIAPWEPPPSDSELATSNQTRRDYQVEAQAAAAGRDSTFARMRSGVWLVTVHGAIHASFSDQPFIAPDRYEVGIEARRALEITNAYLLAFFDRWLKEKHSPLLESKPPFGEVTLETWRQVRHSVY